MNRTIVWFRRDLRIAVKGSIYKNITPPSSFPFWLNSCRFVLPGAGVKPLRGDRQIEWTRSVSKAKFPSIAWELKSP
ncbi:MAG: hypothetical protein HC769_03020 [Cyanobacteria bacterium CRU_2_1]|nr:hypothetical protein [Cyanobacteria bacterium CRU_2_1]